MQLACAQLWAPLLQLWNADPKNNCFHFKESTLKSVFSPSLCGHVYGCGSYVGVLLPWAPESSLSDLLAKVTKSGMPPRPPHMIMMMQLGGACCEAPAALNLPSVCEILL